MKKKRASRRRDTLIAAQARCRRLRKQVAELEAAVVTARNTQKVNEVYVRRGIYDPAPAGSAVITKVDPKKRSITTEACPLPTLGEVMRDMEIGGVQEGGIPPTYYQWDTLSIRVEHDGFVTVSSRAPGCESQSICLSPQEARFACYVLAPELARRLFSP